MQFSIRVLFYTILFFFFVFFRAYLDREGVFITSDGQVKLYQSIGFIENGFGNFECIHPAKDIDPEFKHHLFDYPFAFFEKFKKSKCVFQYPPIFSMFGAISIKLFGLKSISYISLLFYFLCILLFDKILVLLKVNSISIFIGTILSFSFSIFPLSIFDFSEMSFFNLTVLILIYLLVKILYESNRKKIKFGFFQIGFLTIFSFFVRSEVLLLAGIIFLCLLVFFIRTSLIWKLFFFAFIGAMIPICFFVIFNTWSVEFPLGMRTFTVLNDTTTESRTGLIYHLKIAKGFLWKDEEMTGLIIAFPVFLSSLFLFLPSRFKNFPMVVKILLVSGFSYILLASLTTPTKGGVQNFGLRYLEIGLLPLLLGIIFGYSEFLRSKTKYEKIIFLVMLLIALQPSYKFVRDGLNTLKLNSAYYYKMMDYFSEVGNSYIIHDTINSQYLVGTSFIYQKHLYVGKTEEMKKFEEEFKQKKIKSFMIIQNETNPYISINIPDFLKPKYFTRIEYNPKFYKLRKQEKYFNFKLSFYELVE